ncbi:MAG: nucleotidyltransferase family protein [Acidimicrobiia bacterium]|jgi:hypothetical protein
MFDPAAIAAWGLPTAHRLPPGPLADDTFGALLARCETQRVLGFLGSATADGFPVTDAQREQVEERWSAWLGHTVRVERRVLDVLDVLDRAGIAGLVLKGVALSHSAYPDPNLRVFGDVDVLIQPGRLHDAAATLVAAFGTARAEPELRPGYDDRFGREVLVPVGAVEVDLHRTFVNGAYGMRIDLDALFRAPDRVTIGGRAVGVLAPPDRLLHAAYASTLSDWPPRLVAYRDLAQILTHDDPDPDAVLARAAAWRAEAVLATALTDVWRTLRLTDRPPLLEWAERFHATRRDRILLAAARGPARGYTSQLTSLAAIPGLLARIAFLRAVLWPSREYRVARDLGRFGLVGRGARRARRA